MGTIVSEAKPAGQPQAKLQKHSESQCRKLQLLSCTHLSAQSSSLHLPKGIPKVAAKLCTLGGTAKPPKPDPNLALPYSSLCRTPTPQGCWGSTAGFWGWKKPGAKDQHPGRSCQHRCPAPCCNPAILNGLREEWQKEQKGRSSAGSTNRFHLDMLWLLRRSVLVSRTPGSFQGCCCCWLESQPP